MPGGQPRERQRRGRLRVCSRSLRVTSGASPSQPLAPEPLPASLRSKPAAQSQNSSSRAPPGEFTFPLRSRVVSELESEGGGSRRLGPGPGSPQHPAARTQEKKKAREHRGFIKAKTQDHPLGSTNNPRQGFARNKQAPKRNYNEKKSPLRVIVRVLEGGVQRGLRFFRTYTACAKIHHAQSGTSCPDFS